MDYNNLEDFLNDLENGKIRAAKFENNKWVVNTSVKEHILKVFKAGNLVEMNGFVDKHNLPARKFYPDHNVRVVPGGTSIRRGAHLSANTVVMPPSYINIGAFIDEGSMIDSHVLVGSCAQIGKKVHLSTGVQIGGVLEPIGATPVIIEDEAFLGADSVVVEGVRVGKRAVIAPGVILSKGTFVYDLVNEKIFPAIDGIPDRAVVVSGSRPVKTSWGSVQGVSVYCPVIIKYRDEKTETSLVLEEALR